MRSRSKLLVLGAFLAAAGLLRPNVHSSAIRGTGYVRVDEVVKHHPLYPQLSQLDDAIAAINLQSAGAARSAWAPRRSRQQTAELNRELREAQIRANAILAQKQRDYANRREPSGSSALAAAGVQRRGCRRRAANERRLAAASSRPPPRPTQTSWRISRASSRKTTPPARRFSDSFKTQAAQKYRAKAEQLQQNETDLSLRLTQQDASQRLAIKMRLSNLALDPAARKQAADQLAAINQKEAQAVDGQRTADAATLRAYQAELSRQTGDAVRSAGRRDHSRRRVRSSKSIATRSDRSFEASGRRRCRRTYRRACSRRSRRFIKQYVGGVPSRGGQDGRGVQRHQDRPRPAVRRAARRRRRRDRRSGEGTRRAAETPRPAVRSDRRAGQARRVAHCQG